MSIYVCLCFFVCNFRFPVECLADFLKLFLEHDYGDKLLIDFGCHFCFGWVKGHHIGSFKSSRIYQGEGRAYNTRFRSALSVLASNLHAYVLSYCYL